MMQHLFTYMSNALEGQALLALGVAFAWGVLSVVLSPCHLASIPLVVGYVGQQKEITTKRAFWISTFFSLGIFFSIASIGAVTHAAGRITGHVGPWANYAVAAVFFVFGLVLLEVITLPWSGAGKMNVNRKNLLGALSLGLIFGIALGPCTFAFMAPVLAVVTFQPAYGVSLVVLYGLGHCGVIVLAGTFGQLSQRYINFNNKTNTATIVKRICGVLIIIFGLYLIYTAK
ncbi:MAG: cytochrome c biogenesis protein CcdA [Phycisphaerae bacterium]|nr:cytochrome c biogenesis protein CcdA [Phycisphaerae bacterium]